MQSWQEISLLLVVAIPMISAILVKASGEKTNLREGITLLTTVILFSLVLSLAPAVLQGSRPTVRFAEPFPGIPLQLTLEPLGLLFALVASFLWIITSVYSIGYMRAHHEQNQTRFYMYFAIAIAITMGVALAGNLLTLFVFYELLTLTTYPLVTHAGTPGAMRAGRVYLAILLTTSITMLLLAIVWTWNLAGTLEFRPGGLFSDMANETSLNILLLLFIFGVGKAALMPFHRWLPAAMVAPTPVSALLHAVAVVKAGVFALMKISVYIFGLDVLSSLDITQWLLYAVAFTILTASLVAMTRDNLKARLAYSTISQLGYITLGALLATTSGIIGGTMHIAMHAFGKITLFFCAGAIMVTTHKTEVSQMHGIGRTMPITMLAFFIGSCSVIGVPPMGGAWSKWYLALGTLESGQLFWLAVLLTSSLLNIAYLLPIPIRAFLNPQGDNSDGKQIQEAPLACILAIIITALGCVALFVYPEPLYRLVTMVIAR
jgi:multicomponent Na+:H+ antiporter subunit D